MRAIQHAAAALVLALSLAQQTVVEGFVPSSSFSPQHGASLRNRAGYGRDFPRASAAVRGLRSMNMQQQASDINAPIVLPEGLYKLNAEMRLAVSHFCRI